jgi:hypothetical protein
MSFAVVVQGPATHIEAVSAALIDYDVIFSTWGGSNQEASWNNC